ncbi:hypothetical protein HA466_0066760 [Hirschfeldia incana]|nr:hypothetical protein HA466_0066760 [Hirschfeldia incana]
MFSFPLTLMSGRNMKNHRALRASVFDILDGISGKETGYEVPSRSKQVLLDEKKALDDICEDEVITPIKRTCYDWYSLKTLMAKCTTCGGQGHVYISVKTPPLGVKQQAMTCSSCNGTGHVFDLRTSDIS